LPFQLLNVVVNVPACCPLLFFPLPYHNDLHLRPRLKREFADFYPLISAYPHPFPNSLQSLRCFHGSVPYRRVLSFPRRVSMRPFFCKPAGRLATTHLSIWKAAGWRTSFSRSSYSHRPDLKLRAQPAKG